MLAFQMLQFYRSHQTDHIKQLIFRYIEPMKVYIFFTWMYFYTWADENHLHQNLQNKKAPTSYLKQGKDLLLTAQRSTSNLARSSRPLTFFFSPSIHNILRKYTKNLRSPILPPVKKERPTDWFS